MKPRIMFGLIFGLLGMLQSLYDMETFWLYWTAIIGILAGGAGLLTGLREKPQASVDAAKAGAIAGTITGVLILVGQLLGVELGTPPQSYSPDNILNTFFIIIIFVLFVASISVVPAMGFGAVTALIAMPNISQPLMRSIVGQGKKHRLVLIAGVMAAILTYFMMPVFDPILAQSGLLNSWASIKGPPSGIARILGVNGKLDSMTETGAFLMTEVWVETQNGQIFSAPFCVNYQKCDPPQWKSRSKVTNSSDYFTDTRGAACKNLGDLPLNPSGQIVDCMYVDWVNGDLPTEMYFELMADGSLRYFEMDFNKLNVEGKFYLTNLLFYFVMLFLVFRLTRSIAKQIQIKKENASGQASG